MPPKNSVSATMYSVSAAAIQNSLPQFEQAIHHATSVTSTRSAIRASAASVASSVPLIASVRCPNARPWMSLMPP